MKKVNTEGGAYIGGNVDTGGGKFVGRDDNSVSLKESSVENAFSLIFDRIDENKKISIQDKGDIKSELKEIKTELLRGTKANESFIQRRLRNIRRMSPDILDIILAAMINPAAGLGLVAKKVAEKIKAETI